MASRQLEILKAIVDEYVATEEPVGSKTIASRAGLGISPATIRNEMAVLEDAGLITQPHTSAGRIPTNKGYRVFVDQLDQVKPLSNAERKAIENFLDGASDLDDVITRTVRLLAQVTKQVAVVQYPSLSKAKVRHIELVLLNPARVMVVLITDTGRVEQRMVEIPFDISESALSDLHKKLNMAIATQSLANVADKLDSLASTYRDETYNRQEFATDFPTIANNPILATDNWQFLQRRNGSSVNVFGYEIAFQRQLDFLPGFWKGFGIYTNYTYTTSKAKGIFDGSGDLIRENVTLPGTAPHMFNGSLSYENKKLVLRLSANFTSSYVDDSDDAGYSFN